MLLNLCKISLVHQRLRVTNRNPIYSIWESRIIATVATFQSGYNEGLRDPILQRNN